MKKFILLIVTIVALSGCTTGMQSGSISQSTLESVDYKNYTVGIKTKAYVGEKIVSRKAYDVFVRANLIQALNDFSLKGGLASTSINLNAAKGDNFRIAGKNEHGNYVASIPGSIFMFGVNKEGAWDKTVMSSSFWTSPIGSGGQYKITPIDTKFKLVNSTTPASESGYINHELIFTGIGANGISLLYREYTFDNMAREAFKQELVYPSDSTEIRFRNYLIELGKVSSSEIEYTVKSD